MGTIFLCIHTCLRRHESPHPSEVDDSGLLCCEALLSSQSLFSLYKEDFRILNCSPPLVTHLVQPCILEHVINLFTSMVFSVQQIWQGMYTIWPKLWVHLSITPIYLLFEPFFPQTKSPLLF